MDAKLNFIRLPHALSSIVPNRVESEFYVGTEKTECHAFAHGEWVRNQIDSAHCQVKAPAVAQLVHSCEHGE
jgi:hypothetical protein